MLQRKYGANSRPEDLARIIMEDVVSWLAPERLSLKAQERWRRMLTRLFQIELFYRVAYRHIQRTSWSRLVRKVEELERKYLPAEVKVVQR